MASDDPSELEVAVCREVEREFLSHQVPFLAALVEAPSYSREAADVEAAARLVDAEAESFGMSRRLIPDPDEVFATHRIYEPPGVAADDRVLALVGHVDTVFPRELGFIGMERDGDVIRGPGVLDMKSGLSAVLFALGAIERAAPDVFRKLRVRFVMNSDEEVGSPSSRPMLEKLAPLTTEALVFEGGRDEDAIITRRKGTGFVWVHVEGHAAHAGNHHADGVNAIHALSLLIPQIEAITDYERGATVNVGLISGGTSKNTVPPSAKAGLDLRFEHAADGAALLEGLREVVSRPFEGRLSSVTTRLEGGVSRPPMEASDESRALLRRYAECAEVSALGGAEAPLQGGGSDANILTGCGVPCIDGLGPHGKHFHSVREWSNLTSLRRRTEALSRFLLRYAV